jgi:hypothetical protein
MSKIEYTWSNQSMICPYCEYAYQPESEDITEDLYEIECEECGKTFWGTHNIMIYHEGIPDCELNGEKHIWNKDRNNNSFCSVCGRSKPYKKEKQ